MKLRSITFLAVLCSFLTVNFFCINNSNEPQQADTNTTQPPDTHTTQPAGTKAAGTWLGYIIPINVPPIHFNGAKILLKVSEKDSAFHLVARDTTEIVSPTVKDTILVLDGSWRLNSAKDSIALLCSYCRIIDTSTNALYERPVENQRIQLKVNIAQKEASTIWEIPFSDLAALVPLLGLSIPAEQQGILKMFVIDMEKIPD